MLVSYVFAGTNVISHPGKPLFQIEVHSYVYAYLASDSYSTHHLSLHACTY